MLKNKDFHNAREPFRIANPIHATYGALLLSKAT